MKIKNIIFRAGGMTQKLRVPAVLAEDQNLISRLHQDAHNCLYFQFWGIQPPLPAHDSALADNLLCVPGLFENFSENNFSTTVVSSITTFFFLRYSFILIMRVCVGGVYVHLCTNASEARRVYRSPGAGITDSSELPLRGAGN